MLITARNQQKLEKARDELARRTGGEVHAVVADMTKESDIAKMVEAAKQKMGLTILPTSEASFDFFQTPAFGFRHHEEYKYQRSQIAHRVNPEC